MRKIKFLGLKSTILLAIALGSNACSSATPKAINGKFYMMGDSDCKRARVLDSSRISCYNSDDENMGYRNAMSNQELEQYRFKQAQSKADFQNTLNRINYNNQQQMNRNTYNFNQNMNRINDMNSNFYQYNGYQGLR